MLRTPHGILRTLGTQARSPLLNPVKHRLLERSKTRARYLTNVPRKARARLTAIKKNLGFTIDWKTSGKIYLSSLPSLLITYFLLATISLNEWQKIILGCLSFGILYLSSILFLRVLEKQDIRNLRGMFSSMGPLTPFFKVFFTFVEKFVK
jgi:hypothetical protein